MAGSENARTMPGLARLPRFVSIFLLVAHFSIRGTFASAGGRALTQTAKLFTDYVHGNLITDYIGGSGNGIIQFTDVPIDPTVQYIFPLSFAIDADSSGNAQDGVFSPYWSSSLTPTAAFDFVQANPNVLLSVSLAGATQYTDSQTTIDVQWYDPADTNLWISNAFNSITNLAQQYNITGIDVDYENFLENATFTECIGGLITQLKNNSPISVASIAPFGSTLTIYEDLFANFGSVIDFVNYQFYGDSLVTQDDYVERFNTLATSFNVTKLMMSVEVGNRGLQGSDFIAAAQQVATPGIMIWDADNSQQSNSTMENLAAAYLST
jgi:hypothetical protein